MTPNELLALLPYLTLPERAALDRLLTMEAKPKPWRQIARPNQIAPPGKWQIWLLLAGRGFGKTRTIVEWAHEKAMATKSRGNIVASTFRDGRDILVDGPSGFLAVCDPVPVYEASRSRLTWPNGSTATLFSAEEPGRLRGPQCHWAIADELAAWVRPETWDMLLLGLRLGANPQVAVATTPRPTKLIKGLIKDPTAHVTRGSTYDNKANLAEQFIANIVSRYEGTRMGRQELNAEILDDADGVFRRIFEAATAEKADAAIPGHEYVIGVDWGKLNDYTVLTVIDSTTKSLVHMDRFNQINYSTQIGRLQGLCDRFKPQSIIAEKNSIGEPLIESLMGLGLPVQAFTTTNSSKQNIIDGLALAFEQGQLRILYDADLIEELQAYEAKRLPGGLLRYSAPAGLHDDCVMSLAMAWQQVNGYAPMFL